MVDRANVPSTQLPCSSAAIGGGAELASSNSIAHTAYESLRAAASRHLLCETGGERPFAGRVLASRSQSMCTMDKPVVRIRLSNASVANSGDRRSAARIACLGAVSATVSGVRHVESWL
jgi:hypothetical protein